jgi:hypothetical protein
MLISDTTAYGEFEVPTEVTVFGNMTSCRAVNLICVFRKHRRVLPKADKNQAAA